MNLIGSAGAWRRDDAIFISRAALLDVRQMGEADRPTIAAGITGAALMENAGRAVAKVIMERLARRSVNSHERPPAYS